MNCLGRYFKRLFAANRDFILQETLAANGVMALLMKNRNTGERWTKDEVKQLRRHFLRLAMLVPALIVFLLPLGSVMLPVLAEVLDRRKVPRNRPAL